ncbi:murein biosynthesis integral membrane protein MurJ [Blastococcus haudaquaticus]|uniref:Putative peptidoglycan lipid II flippase n=1 Tax=Blastococcus haudaquaticus TaxID=1938745 RepID=A0A286GZA0_9ACTN|nr:murein biosynthesis integral membrane protein MurJ [Blastococcus haudaquaticus]SOE00429.1 putative peptidoglycan lipid II flippase [Blastococcus haudaquaticus]
MTGPARAADEAAVAPERADAGARPGMTHKVRLLYTAGLVTAIEIIGAVLGLLRDVLLAHYFGASAETDAFLVAWMIPETASPLLMEGALAYLLVPRLARELELRGTVQRVLDRSVIPLGLLLAGLTALVALLAPGLVAVLAPGLAEPELAVRCVRAAAPTILFLGLSGVLMATLRAHQRFLVPAWVYVVYNVGILACLLLLHDRLGIFAAALGLSVGAAGMVALQLGPFLRRVHVRNLRLGLDRGLLLAAVAFLPVGLYTLGRQAQVVVERFFGSTLDAGTISHLNYATKVAQIPLALAMAIAMVSMPSLARHAAGGRTDELRAGVEQTLRLAVLVILPAIAALVACAPQVIQFLFLRGEFTAGDVAETAVIMRVYAVGLLGQTLVGVLATCYWSRAQRTWWPAVATASGLAATVGVSVLAVGPLGATGLALANAVGITVAAALLLVGLRSRVVALPYTPLLGLLARATVAGGAAGLAAWAVLRGVGDSLPVAPAVVVGGLVVAAVYGATTWVLQVPEVRAGATALVRRTRGRAAD